MFKSKAGTQKPASSSRLWFQKLGGGGRNSRNSKSPTVFYEAGLGSTSPPPPPRPKKALMFRLPGSEADTVSRHRLLSRERGRMLSSLDSKPHDYSPDPASPGRDHRFARHGSAPCGRGCQPHGPGPPRPDRGPPGVRALQTPEPAGAAGQRGPGLRGPGSSQLRR